MHSSYPKPEPDALEEDIQQALSDADIDGLNDVSPLLAKAMKQRVEEQEALFQQLGFCLPYPVVKIGIQVQKYPWQSLAAVAVTIGCGWVCVYFGLTVLGALLLFGFYWDEPAPQNSHS